LGQLSVHAGQEVVPAWQAGQLGHLGTSGHLGQLGQRLTASSTAPVTMALVSGMGQLGQTGHRDAAALATACTSAHGCSFGYATYISIAPDAKENNIEMRQRLSWR
jgi:hypothetical protein